jgi:hypothetical protein
MYQMFLIIEKDFKNIKKEKRILLSMITLKLSLNKKNAIFS